MEKNKSKNVDKKSTDSIEELGKKLKGKTGMAVLSYIWILCLIPLLMSKDEFVRFHAKQGFVLFIIEVALVLVAWIPVIGWLLCLAVLVVVIIAIIKVLNGEKWEIPYIYKISKKIKI